MTIRRRRTKDQGELGVADAIAWFAYEGWTVSVPLVDNQGYDLVADDGQQLHRVQVKTATSQAPSGGWIVELRTNGGNQTRLRSRPFDAAASDLLYVLTDGGRWLIPTCEVAARTSLTLGATWARYALREDRRLGW